MKSLFLSIAAGMLLAVAPVIAKEQAAVNSDLELARRLENVFEKVAAQTSESVVVITAKIKAGHHVAGEEDEDDPDQPQQNPFEYFFKHHHGMPVPKPHDAEVQGSGVILRPGGYILTNGHVIDGADDIKVRLKDGREFSAKVVGADPRTDVAVIKIEAKDLPAAQLGDSEKVKVGQWAVAIGAPFELDYSFTVGFISGKGRSAVWSRTGTAYEDYLQTDASINPGNSGGPLCDIEGRVVGINTLIRGMNTGIGFAIPINMAKDIATQLIDKGRIVRPWIGIRIEPLSENRELTDVVKDGVVVRGIEPNAPAAKSELKLADIITAVDGVNVKTPRELQQQILHKQVGQTLSLDVIRDGKPAKVDLKTAEMIDARPVAAKKVEEPELRSGKDVVSPVGPIYPSERQGAPLAAACEEGNASFHGTGIHPGGATEVFPLMFSAMSSAVTLVRVEEFSDIRTYGAADVVRHIMCFGGTREEAEKGLMVKALGSGFKQSIHMVLQALGLAGRAEIRTVHAVAVATAPIDSPIGTIEPGNVAGQRFHWEAVVGGEVVVRIGVHWLMGEENLDPPWTFGDQGVRYEVEVKGNPDTFVTIKGWQPRTVEEGLVSNPGVVATAAHCVNSVPYVCAAPPGIVTSLQLPLVAGRAHPTVLGGG